MDYLKPTYRAAYRCQPWGRDPDKLSSLILLYADVLYVFLTLQSSSLSLKYARVYQGINLCKSSSTQGGLHPTRGLFRTLGDLSPTRTWLILVMPFYKTDMPPLAVEAKINIHTNRLTVQVIDRQRKYR